MTAIVEAARKGFLARIGDAWRAQVAKSRKARRRFGELGDLMQAHPFDGETSDRPAMFRHYASVCKAAGVDVVENDRAIKAIMALIHPEPKKAPAAKARPLYGSAEWYRENAFLDHRGNWTIGNGKLDSDTVRAAGLPAY